MFEKAVGVLGGIKSAAFIGHVAPDVIENVARDRFRIPVRA